MTTREQILQTALAHLSQKGFKGVSMRDIADDVGIRAASIYYHFRGKQELVAAVYVHIEEVLAGNMLEQEKVKSVVKDQPFGALWGEWFTEYKAVIRTAPYQNIIRLLSMEQYTDETAARLILEYMFEKPLSIAGDICRTYLPKKGIHDPDTIAAEFFYPLFGMMHELLLRMFHNQETKAIEQRMEKHIRFIGRIIDDTQQ